MIITVDGPVATGKSTVAKKLAKALGYIYFDTGAMYRAITYTALENKIDIHDEKALADLLEKFDFKMKIYRGEKRYFVNEQEVTEQIRTPEVTKLVSEVAAIPEVRAKLMNVQRKLAIGVNAIFEGRDMGTEVFPSADLKIFLYGKPEVRAQRRYAEMIERFPDLKETLTLEKVLEELNQRDLFDASRKIAPLRRAEDAHPVDTSNLSADEVVVKILEIKDSLRSH